MTTYVSPLSPPSGLGIETTTTMKTSMIQHVNNSQFAYAGRYSVRQINSDQLLIHGGGVIAPRPRLYDTPEAAIEAAAAIKWTACEAVLIVQAGPARHMHDPITDDDGLEAEIPNEVDADGMEPEIL